MYETNEEVPYIYIYIYIYIWRCIILFLYMYGGLSFRSLPFSSPAQISAQLLIVMRGDKCKTTRMHACMHACMRVVLHLSPRITINSCALICAGLEKGNDRNDNPPYIYKNKIIHLHIYIYIYMYMYGTSSFVSYTETMKDGPAHKV